MAAKSFTNAAGDQYNGAVIGSWSLLNGDTGNAYAVPLYADKSVSVEGALGAGTIVIEGTLDGTNFYTLNDPQGNALTFTAGTKRIEAILENVVAIRPRISVADAAINAVVNLIAR